MGVNVVEDEFETRTHMQVWRWVWGVRERVSVCGWVGGWENLTASFRVRELVWCGEQIRKTQDEPQWIVAQGLLSALTIPGFK